MLYIKLKNGYVSEIGEVDSQAWDSFIEVMGDSHIQYTGDKNYIYVGGEWDEENQRCKSPAPPEPVYSDISRDLVITKLDNLREDHITRYVSMWGVTSKQTLWPLLERELGRIDEDILEITASSDKKPIAWPKFPSLRGYIGARLGKDASLVTDEEVRTTASLLQTKKSEHTRLLTITEIVRSQILKEFEDLVDNQEKTEYFQRISSRWEELLNAQT